MPPRPNSKSGLLHLLTTSTLTPRRLADATSLHPDLRRHQGPLHRGQEIHLVNYKHGETATERDVDCNNHGFAP